MFGYKVILSIKNRALDLWKIALLAVVPLLAVGSMQRGRCARRRPLRRKRPPPPQNVLRSPRRQPPALKVVSTTNIVADWVENIGGEHVEVFSLLPIGVDPHTYQPGAQDVARIADADLVLSVGLGLEEAWLHELVESAARDESSIVELAELVDPDRVRRVPY